jgi:hypothetical protein
MRNELTLAVLLYIKRRVLNGEKKFTVGYHFVDKDGQSLAPAASSIPKVAQRCIGGAVIEALVALDIEKDASSASHGYEVVMYALGDSLGDFPRGSDKIDAVMKANNEQGYTAIRKLVDDTAEKLYQNLMRS